MKKCRKYIFLSTRVVVLISILVLSLKFINIVNAEDDLTITISSEEVVCDQSKDAVVIAPELIISGPENTQITKAKIEVVKGYSKGNDTFIYQSIQDVNLQWSPQLGILLGNESIENYQKALRLILFKTQGRVPENVKVIRFTVFANGKQAFAEKTVGIRAINTVPMIKLSNPEDPLLYTEKEPFKVLDEYVEITDTDGGNIASAIISIYSSFVEGEDFLECRDQDKIIENYDQTTGKLFLTGIASVSEYQQLFRSIAYKNTSSNPNTIPRTIKYYIKDDCGAEAIQTKVINIQSVNDLPEIIINPETIHFVEGDAALTIDNGIRINDPDSLNMSSAEIWIKEGYEDLYDTIEFNEVEGINASFDHATGKLSMVGNVTREKYEEFFSGIRFYNSSKNPSNEERLIELTVTDDEGGISLSARKLIAVTPVISEDEIVKDENGDTKGEDPIDNETPLENDVPPSNTKPSDSIETPIEPQKTTTNKSRKNKEVETPIVQMQITEAVDTVQALSYIENSYKDISSCLWAEKEITFAVSMDLIKSETSDEFQPYKSITRAEFIYGIMKLLNMNIQGEISFVDVDKDAYYYKEIALAKFIGIVRGIGEDELGANEYITRQDMITIAARAAIKMNLLKVENASSLVEFEDYESIAQYAKESIELLVGEGIIKGGGVNLYPNRPTTRAEAAIVFYRLYERLIMITSHGL